MPPTNFFRCGCAKQDERMLQLKYRKNNRDTKKLKNMRFDSKYLKFGLRQSRRRAV